MTWLARHGVWVAIALLVGGAGPSHAQPTAADAAAVAPAPEDPLRALAERLAQPDGSAGAPEPAGAVGPSDLEARPLGTSIAGADATPTPSARSPVGGSWIVSTLSALGLVIALVLLLRWAWGRFGGGTLAGATPAVEVLTRTQVAPRNHVLLVRVGGRILVLGDSAGGLRTLADIEEPEEVASLLESVTANKPTSITRGFMQMLSQSERSFDPAVEAAARGGVEAGADRARESVAGLLARVKAMSIKGDG